MSIFGKVSNIFKSAISTFAYTGHTFKETWDKISDLPWKTTPIKAYRQYTETRTFHRQKAFWEKAPEIAIPDIRSITPTQQRLKHRFQYIFNTKIITTKGIGIERATFSMYSDVRLTKATMEKQMLESLYHKENLEKYGEIIDIDVELVGVRQSKWIK